MIDRFTRIALACLLTLGFLAAPTRATPSSPTAGGDRITVVSVSPVRHTLTASRTAPIVVQFDRPVSIHSLAQPYAFRVFGERSGMIVGTFTFSGGGTMAHFAPDAPLARGERVTVTISHAIQATDATFLRDAGYVWQYWVSAAVADMTFDLIGTLDTTEKGVSPRPYGGSAVDFDGDHSVDLAIINEDTSDIRVFMNRADGTGLFDEFMQPTNATGATPSPNHAADFNDDARIDICTANSTGSNVSVLFGNGDGTFDGRSDYPVGATPTGLAVLDVDGDGDPDIATANRNGNNIALLLNDGRGGFGPASFFEGGGQTEYALDAADMNNDGILDLVVGAQGSGRVIVHLGNWGPCGVCPEDLNGDGTVGFTDLIMLLAAWT